MDSLSKQEQILLLGAFAMAVRNKRFSDSCFNTLAEGTGRGTISNVVQTFWLLGGNASWKNPHLHYHAYRQVVERRFSLLHP
jgi:hypothetical protein